MSQSRVHVAAVKTKTFYDLLRSVFLSERVQSKSRDLENPPAVHVTIGTGQVTVWLESRLVHVEHSLARTEYRKTFLWTLWSRNISNNKAIVFVDITSLTGGQPNFARSLAISWADTLYIHFWGLLPLTEFYHLQNSLCLQVLHSPILAALLHGTRAAAVSQTLWRGTRNGITELSQRAPPIFGWTAIISK